MENPTFAPRRKKVKKMFDFNPTAWILGAIPSGFWLGLIAGTILAAIVGGAVCALLSFILRHWRAVLVLCAIVAAVSLAILAL